MKKAIAVTELMLLIITVVAGIGLIVFTKKSTASFGCMRDVELCRESYGFYGSIKQKAGFLGVAPRVDCIAISPPNCNEKVLKTGDKEETMRIIAENLRWCWYKTLGNNNKMGEDFAKAALLPRQVAELDVDFCLVCSEFTPKVNINIDEWLDFLDKKRMLGADKTYSEFLDVKSQDKLKAQWSKAPDSPLDYIRGFRKDTKYYVVSVSAEGTDEGLVGLYISPDIYCGEKTLEQVHYQLR